MTRSHMNTLEPPDDLERAQEAYEASGRFLTDALEYLSEHDPDDLPVNIVARVAVWYSGTGQYDLVIEDIMAGEVTP